MSQLPPASQPPVPSESTTALTIYQDRRRSILNSRNAISKISAKAPARLLATWLIRHLDELARQGQLAGIEPEKDPEICSLIKSARESLLPFATSDWLQFAPGFVSECADLLKDLNPGVTLAESMSDVASEVPQVRASGLDSSPSISVPPPSTGPSPLMVPSPFVVLPSLSCTSSSGASPSPRSVPDSDTNPATRRSRTTHSLRQATLLRETHRCYRSPKVSSSVEDNTTHPGAAPSSTVTPAVAPVRSSEFRPPQSCTRCKKKRKGCRYPEGADHATSPCALCINNKATCTWPTGPPHSPLRTSRVQKPKKLPVPTAPATKSAPMVARIPEDDDKSYLEDLPEIPLHSSLHVAVGDLLAWRNECISSSHEVIICRLDHSSAQDALRASEKALRISELTVGHTETHLLAAVRRRRMAYRAFIDLYSAASADHSRVLRIPDDDDKSYPEDLPEIPLHSSPHVANSDLLAWRNECTSSSHEVVNRRLAHSSAQDALRASEKVLRISELTVGHTETDLLATIQRRKVAYRAFIDLYGSASADHRSAPGPSVAKGTKGKARATLSDEDDI